MIPTRTPDTVERREFLRSPDRGARFGVSWRILIPSIRQASRPVCPLEHRHRARRGDAAVDNFRGPGHSATLSIYNGCEIYSVPGGFRMKGRFLWSVTGVVAASAVVCVASATVYGQTAAAKPYTAPRTVP